MSPERKWRYSYMGTTVEDFERKQDAILELTEKFNLDPKYAALFVESYYHVIP